MVNHLLGPKPDSSQPRYSRLARMALPCGAGGIAATATWVLVLLNPYERTVVICPSLALLGIQCPACGGLRSTVSLAHGEFLDAWAMNPLWVMSIPVVVVWWLVWCLRSWSGASYPLPSMRIQGVVLWVLGVFMVIRNIPWVQTWLEGLS